MAVGVMLEPSRTSRSSAEARSRVLPSSGGVAAGVAPADTVGRLAPPRALVAISPRSRHRSFAALVVRPAPIDPSASAIYQLCKGIVNVIFDLSDPRIFGPDPYHVGNDTCT